MSSDETTELLRYFDELKASIDQRFDDLKAGVDQRFDAMDQRFERLERKVDDLAAVVQGMSTGHAARFDAIEERLGRGPLRVV